MELELRRCVAPLNGRINHWDWDTRLPLQLFTCVMFHGLKMRVAFITALARKNIHSCLLCVKMIPLQCFILSARYLFIIWLAHYLHPILSHNFITVRNLSWKGAEQRCSVCSCCLGPRHSCIRLVLNRKSDEVLLRDSISIMPRKCHGLPVYISVSEKRNTLSGKQDVSRMSPDYF